MLFIIGFTLLGGTYAVIRSDTFAGIVAFAALLYAMSFVVAPFVWFGQKAGTINFVHSMWLSMGGIERPVDMVQECEQQTDNLILGLTAILLTMALIIVFMGGGTMMLAFGLPVGAVMFLYGSVLYVATRDDKALLRGTKVLSVAVAGILIAGLGINIIHFVSGLDCA